MAGRGAYKKKAENIANVRARHDLLIEGIEKPKDVNKAVHATLTGQRAFAALNLPDSKITKIALNTLKSLSEELFTDPDGDGLTGFAQLDALRVRLEQRLLEAAASRTVEAKAERVADKNNISEARHSATEAQSVKRSKAYLSLYTMINGLIKDGDLQAEAQVRLYRILDNHHAAFSDLFEPDFTSATGDAAKVTKLGEKTKSK